MSKHEIGEVVHRHCSVDGMVTEHKVIKSTYSDTNAYICTQCQSTDEETI